MTRSELVARVTEDACALSPQQVREAVDAFFEAIARRLVNGGRAELRGFGMFATKRDGARAARNPRTGEAVFVGERRKVVFRCAKTLAARVDACSR